MARTTTRRTLWSRFTKWVDSRLDKWLHARK
jgi:hypothetical protein